MKVIQVGEGLTRAFQEQQQFPSFLCLCVLSELPALLRNPCVHSLTQRSFSRYFIKHLQGRCSVLEARDSERLKSPKLQTLELSRTDEKDEGPRVDYC